MSQTLLPASSHSEPCFHVERANGTGILDHHCLFAGLLPHVTWPLTQTTIQCTKGVNAPAGPQTGPTRTSIPAIPQEDCGDFPNQDHGRISHVVLWLHPQEGGSSPCILYSGPTAPASLSPSLTHTSDQIPKLKEGRAGHGPRFGNHDGSRQTSMLVLRKTQPQTDKNPIPGV